MSKQTDLMRKARMRKRAKGIPHLPPSHGQRALLKRMPREHPDVLQNIEFALVQIWRQDPRADDAAADAALKAHLAGSDGAELANRPQAEAMFLLVQSMRDFRQDISDDVWRDCLLTVRQSVHRHSSLRPGQRSYLHFAAPFVP